MDVNVGIITVESRREECARTVASWQTAGVEPRVFVQPADWPLNQRSHGRWYRRVLAMLIPGHRHVVVCEDDVDVAPRLRRWWPRVLLARGIVTLYLPGRSHYPAAAWRADLRRGPEVYPVIGQRTWYGSQCIVYTAEIAAELCTLPEPDGLDGAGFDTVLRTWLTETGRQLYTVFPNLAQHRAPRSVISARYQAHRSISFDLLRREP